MCVLISWHTSRWNLCKHGGWNSVSCVKQICRFLRVMRKSASTVRVRKSLRIHEREFYHFEKNNEQKKTVREANERNCDKHIWILSSVFKKKKIGFIFMYITFNVQYHKIVFRWCFLEVKWMLEKEMIFFCVRINCICLRKNNFERFVLVTSWIRGGKK